MFDFLVEYLIKISRIIKTPYGHGILIAMEGSGLSELVRLAIFICAYENYEIRLEPNYVQDDWFNDLKTLLTMVGVDEKQTVFYFQHTQILNEDFLHDLNSLVNNGEIHGIFNKEEYENIISQTQVRLSHAVSPRKFACADLTRLFLKFRTKPALTRPHSCSPTSSRSAGRTSTCSWGLRRRARTCARGCGSSARW